MLLAIFLTLYLVDTYALMKLAENFLSRHSATTTDGHRQRHAREPVCASRLSIKGWISIQECQNSSQCRTSEAMVEGLCWLCSCLELDKLSQSWFKENHGEKKKEKKRENLLQLFDFGSNKSREKERKKKHFMKSPPFIVPYTSSTWNLSK